MNDPAPPHALLRPRIALPFLTISLIWGSTWFVITGQIDGVPPAWSVAWRFVLATLGMFALARATGNALGMPKRAHVLALAIGLTQFCGNYMLVYQAELHLTSGIVAVMIGLMIVPNAVLGRALLGQPITARFLLGSAIAIGGIAVLLVNEARETRLGGDVGLGIWLALGAMAAASVSNVIQAGETGRQVPLMTLIAWPSTTTSSGVSPSPLRRMPETAGTLALRCTVSAERIRVRSSPSSNSSDTSGTSHANGA